MAENKERIEQKNRLDRLENALNNLNIASQNEQMNMRMNQMRGMNNMGMNNMGMNYMGMNNMGMNNMDGNELYGNE